jgi:hypothetical protein
MGDWDGNGTSTPAVWRNGVFYLRNANTTGNADIVVHYGNPDDLPIVGDWNGDGTDTIGARRGSEFFLRNTNTTGNADLQYQFGNGGELPIVGDWNGTGGDKPGVYRVSYNPATQDVTHQVFMRTTHSTGIADLPPVEIPPTDEGSPYPMVADFDANGTEDVNSYNYNSGIWYTPTIGSFAYGNPDDVDSPVTWGTRS